jgi:hypothetical protein
MRGKDDMRTILPSRGGPEVDWGSVMRIAVLALVLSIVALGVAVFAPTRESPPPERAPVRTERVAVLEARIAELSREIESLKADRAGRIPRDSSASPAIPPRTASGEVARPSELPEADEALKAIVDDAVDRKTGQVIDELRIKADKKPAMDVFASVLELTEEQRAETERVVVEGQRQVHRILGTPTYDGTLLMDELVEIFAKGIAEPGKDHGFGRWLGRVLTEKIPGTDETYATRIESVKSAMRATFKQRWSAAQYSEFEEWGVDPTEIRKVPGSPNEALEKRIVERATALGAQIPDDR